MRNNFLGDVQLGPDEEEEIRQKVRDMSDPITRFSERINPKMVGVEKKKEALLLALASPHDAQGDRGRVHVLLYGPPGTGKSAILTWLRDHLSAGYASKKSTEAGIVGSMAHGKARKGILPKNHRGVCVVDELDKMKKEDREGLLECMSEGRVTMQGSEVEESWRANTIVLASANDKEKLTKKLRHRFDLRLKFGYYDRETGKKILEDKSKNFLKKKGDEEDITTLKKYLKAVRRFDIEIDKPEACKRAIEEFLEMNDIKEVNPRDHMARFMRIGLCHARLHFRKPRIVDFAEAIHLLLGDSHYATEGLKRLGRDE